MLIVYDDNKRRSNLAKHGFDFAGLTIDFFAKARVFESNQDRLVAIGLFEGSAIAVVFRLLGEEALSVISMRPASRKERKLL